MCARWVTVLGVLAGVMGAACAADPAPLASAPPDARPTLETPQGHGARVDVSVPDDASAAAAGRAMGEAARRGGVPCPNAVLAWGDLREVGDARPMRVTSGGASLQGVLVCEADVPSFLAAQRDNPRLAGHRGGSCTLRWGGGQLFMRRASSDLGEAALGDLAASGNDALQKGELLAAIFDPVATPPDGTGLAVPVLAALARVPRFFLFGLWPLPR